MNYCLHIRGSDRVTVTATALVATVRGFCSDESTILDFAIAAAVSQRKAWKFPILTFHQRRHGDMWPLQANKIQDNRLRVLQLQEAIAIPVFHGLYPEDRGKCVCVSVL